MTLSTFFDRRRRWATLAVILGVLFLARLGFWQLDRLEWRRGLNLEKEAALNADPIDLNQMSGPLDPEQLHNHLVSVTGRYEFDEQLLVETQLYEGQQGRYLLTPLRIDGTEMAILVNRGWIPSNETDFSTFDTTERVVLSGRLQRSQTLNRDRESEVTADRRIYRIDVEAAAAVMPYPIMSMYLLPEGADVSGPDQLPRLVAADLTIDEGSHLSYAIQWFTFALMLAVIYVVLVYRQNGERKRQPTADR